MSQKVEFVLKSVILSYSLSFLLTLGVMFSFKFIYVKLPVNLCLPFIDPTNSASMVKIITRFTVISQTASSAVIMVMYNLRK